MTIRLSILAALIICATLFAQAQVDSTSMAARKVKYFNAFSAGGLTGKSGQGTGATLSMIHGIRMNRLAIGGGVAFDGYRNWNVVPVFGSASYDVVRIKSNALFVQLNVGYSFANRITDTEQMFNNYNAYGSQMINSMVGYRIKAKQYRLYMQVGHKYQVVHYKFDPMPSWSSFWMPAVSVEENLNRFVVAIGLGLN